MESGYLHDRFWKRVELVSAFLRDEHGIDTSLTIANAVTIFLKRAGLDPNFIGNNRKIFHELAHVSGCATSGSLRDEVRAASHELMLNRGSYLANNCNNKDLYHLRYNSIAKPFPDFENIKKLAKWRHTNALRISASLIEDLKGWPLLNPLNIQKLLKLKQQYKDQIPPSEEQIRADAEQAKKQAGFFEAVYTEGRPLYMFSSESAARLPAISLAIEYKKNANGKTEPFTPLSPQKMAAIIQDVAALKFEITS